ncbi:MAG: D-cysteine desulfhydrase [Lysobacterales bacterium]|nr:MAG: D-cysteine desulfhydrase [Xanthomonadales bacterium]
MPLADFPRIPLAHLPTPLEPLPRLSEALGGPSIWVKRDDCTGLGGGGNKTRKLEFLMAAARQQGADTIITPGAVQSNHARQTAAAAAKLGMGCHLLLENIGADTDRDYRASGNIFLDRIFHAHLHHFPNDTDLDLAAESLAAELRETGRVPYVIPTGGSNALGALGYVVCAMELMTQAKNQKLSIDHLILATGSAGTQAGLLAGLHLQRSKISVLGMCVSRSAEEQKSKVGKLCDEVLELLESTRALPRAALHTNGDYVGQGYGLPTRGMIKAVALAASSEGLLLDPVYTGKAMAGLVDLIATGKFKAGDNLVFLHTGGSPALFAYRSTFDSL